MDGLLTELTNSEYGCYVGAPRGYAVHQMTCISDDYAKKYDVMFNVKKGQLIIYKTYDVRTPYLTAFHGPLWCCVCIINSYSTLLN